MRNRSCEQSHIALVESMRRFALQGHVSQHKRIHILPYPVVCKEMDTSAEGRKKFGWVSSAMQLIRVIGILKGL